jgi:hypothetical protein
MQEDKNRYKIMYLRFIGTEIHSGSGTEKGIFKLAYELEKSALLNKNEDVVLKELLAWFEDNLPKPKIFDNEFIDDLYKSLFICWFKDSSTEMLSKIWDLKYLLENHDIMIEVIKSDNIGHIRYNDEFQAVARPDRKALSKIRRN